MGYYTYYELRLKNTPNPKKVINEFRETCLLAELAFDEDGMSETDIKWYDHKKDLINFSKRYPKILFILKGVGEEATDIWKLYVKNEKFFLAKAEITFPTFEENLLEITSTDINTVW